METRFFAPAYMRLLYRFLRLPVEQEHLLFIETDTNAADLLAVNPAVQFPTQMQICRNALSISPPGLGLRMGRQLQLATHGALGIAMQNATNLDEALQVYAEFCAARASFFSITRKASGEHHILTLDFDGLDDDLIPFFSESILATIDHCLTFYASNEAQDKRVELAFPAPTYGTQYRDYFEASIEFDAPRTAFDIPTRLLETSTYDRDPVLFNDAIQHCRHEIGTQSQAATTAMRVEGFLRSNIGKLWKSEDLAEALSMSKRTLLRRLRDEQTSYQQIRDQLLKEHAVLYLRSMSVETVGIALGFADESSFRRSFKRWCGVSPSEYRELFQ